MTRKTKRNDRRAARERKRGYRVGDSHPTKENAASGANTDGGNDYALNDTPSGRRHAKS